MKITVNGEPKEVAARIGLARLLQELRINVQQVAVEVNAELVPRERHHERELADGDALEIVTLVGGG